MKLLLILLLILTSCSTFKPIEKDFIDISTNRQVDRIVDEIKLALSFLYKRCMKMHRSKFLCDSLLMSLAMTKIVDECAIRIIKEL